MKFAAEIRNNPKANVLFLQSENYPTQDMRVTSW